MTHDRKFYELTTELLEAAESVNAYPNLNGPRARLKKATTNMRAFRRQHSPRKAEYLLEQSGRNLTSYWL